MPRPGHADLAGAQLYGLDDLRDVIERASARETAARVACGAVARRLLAVVGCAVVSHVVAIAGVAAEPVEPRLEDFGAVDDDPLRCLDSDASARMRDAITAAGQEGDTVGGVFEVAAFGFPPGVGSYAQADRRLGGRLAAAVLGIPAIKGVEIGLGFAAHGGAGRRSTTRSSGRPAKGYGRASNRAGGIEGGISTGLPIVVRAAMKPIATLLQPLAACAWTVTRSSKPTSSAATSAPCRRRLWSARPWSLCASPTPPWSASAAPPSTPSLPPSSASASGYGARDDEHGADRLHGRRQEHASVASWRTASVHRSSTPTRSSSPVTARSASSSPRGVRRASASSSARSCWSSSNGRLRCRVVVALGGGAVTSDDVREALTRLPHVVWLDAPPQVLFARARRSGNRPLAASEALFEALLAERRPLYEAACTDAVHLQGRERPSFVADRVLRLVTS